MSDSNNRHVVDKQGVMAANAVHSAKIEINMFDAVSTYSKEERQLAPLRAAYKLKCAADLLGGASGK